MPVRASDFSMSSMNLKSMSSVSESPTEEGERAREKKRLLTNILTRVEWESNLLDRVLTNIQRQHAVSRVSQRGHELQCGFLQPEDMGENVLVETRYEVELGSGECEAGLLELNGDGHLTGSSVHRKMGNLDGRIAGYFYVKTSPKKKAAL